MTTPRFYRIAAAGLAVAAMAGLSACRMFAPDEAPRLLTSQEKQALTKRAKTPQVFGLTVYSSPEGAVFAGAYRVHEGQTVRLEFTSDKNSTTPTIMTEHENILLVDSSAGEGWLTVAAFEDMGGIPLKDAGLFEKTPRHVYDLNGGIAAIVPKVIFDTVHVESSIFYVRNKLGPLDLLARWEKSPPIVGVLGADFIRAFKFVRISLADRYLVLSATTEYPGTPAQVAAVPLVDKNGGLAVEAMVDGNKETIILDIAGDFEIANGAPAPGTIRQVSIGDVVFRQVESVPGAEIGLGLDPGFRIGRQLLEKYDLVFNNYGKQLILERPPR